MPLHRLLCHLVLLCCSFLWTEGAFATTQDTLENVQTFTLPSNVTVTLLSMPILHTMTVKDKQFNVQNTLYSLDIENNESGERRRVWQREFIISSPHDRLSSFLVAPAEPDHLICFGFVRAFDVSVFLVDITKNLPPLEQNTLNVAMQNGETRLSTTKDPSCLGLFGLLESNAERMDIGNGVTLESLAYTVKDGWSVTLRLEKMRYSVHGIVDGENITWTIVKKEAIP